MLALVKNKVRHQSLFEAPLLENHLAAGTGSSHGIWGAVTKWLSPYGTCLFYLPVWGPPSVKPLLFPASGYPAPSGSITAFAMLEPGGAIVAEPRWTTRYMIKHGSAILANDLVNAEPTSDQTLQNTRTSEGRRLFSTTPGSMKKSLDPGR